MAVSTPVVFSPSGEYCMYSSPDGVLKLWETSTSKLCQQYTPSSHLTATCTCLSWGPKQHTGTTNTPKKKKKRKSLDQTEHDDIVAIGTSSGNILLYSIVKADIQTQLDKGHSDSINDLCWDESQGYLYSCSSDNYVIQWDVSTASVKQKWKADKGTIHSVSLCSTNHVLTAGRSIKLWNIDNTELLKTFTGHKTEIFRLLPLRHTALSTDSPDNMYFLSAAQNDRIVNTWQITDSKAKSSIASFSLPEEPIILDIAKQSSNQVVLLCVVTRSGQVVIFEHTLNGRLKKPIKPKVTLQVSTPGTKDSLPVPIPILAAHICDHEILIVHGNFLKPTFEKLPYNSADPVQCLIREDPRKISLSTDKAVSKIRTPDVTKDSTVLVPGLMAPSGPSQQAGKRSSKRKPSITDMTMEERVNAISFDNPNQSGKEPPQADTLARLLTQGLQSQDKKLINSVLMQATEKVVENTVRKLPLQAIIPLVQELSSRMHTHAQCSSKILRWLKTLLSVHTSYLMTFPDMVENLSNLYQMMDSRSLMFNKLSRLQGKLDLVLSQITNQTQVETDSTEQPLLMYQEESSDEDFGLTDFAPTQSDTEENSDLFDDDDDDDEDMVDGKQNGVEMETE